MPKGAILSKMNRLSVADNEQLPNQLKQGLARWILSHSGKKGGGKKEEEKD